METCRGYRFANGNYTFVFALYMSTRARQLLTSYNFKNMCLKWNKMCVIFFRLFMNIIAYIGIDNTQWMIEKIPVIRRVYPTIKHVLVAE